MKIVAILVGIVFLLSIGSYTSRARADCRPPLTVTTTDFNRLAEATDDFIEINYLQANVTWNVQSIEKATNSAVLAWILVGPMISPGNPGALLIAKAKLYQIGLERECAGAGWKVTSFHRP